MFLLIPIALILLSLSCIVLIIWRKKPYLDKLYVLNTAGNDIGDSALIGLDFEWRTYGLELFPEIKTLIEKLKFHEYRMAWLKEAEKFLRRARLLSLRIDRLSDTLIKKIRRVNTNGRLNGEVALKNTEEEKETMAVSNSAAKATVSSNFLKNEEERLIIEIAKNPKDPNLYEQLGDLYMEMNNFIDGKESYEAAIELNPQNESFKQKLSSVLGKITPQN